MDIESGEVCKQYVERMSAKQSQDRERKSTKQFKYQRKKLHLARRVKGKEGEKREGITYCPGIATELSTLQDKICETILNINMRDVEKSEKDAEIQANRVADKPPRDSAIIYFDGETASRTKNCEILQLAAVSKHSSFSSYITPTFDIATSATAVDGLRVAYNNEGKS